MKAQPYYTNSSHLPVSYTEDVFAALDVQDKLQPLYTSGTWCSTPSSAAARLEAAAALCVR